MLQVTVGVTINGAIAHKLPLTAAYAHGSDADLVLDGQPDYCLRSDTRASRVAADRSRAGITRVRGESGPVRGAARQWATFHSFTVEMISMLVSLYALSRRWAGVAWLVWGRRRILPPAGEPEGVS